METLDRQDENHSYDQRSSPALDMAAAFAGALGQAQILPLRPEDETLLEGTAPFRFGPDDSRQGWSIGAGPAVILVHGYSGSGIQMAPLARHIAEAGYRCVFFDAGGHGSSRPEKVGFHTLINDTRDLFHHLGGAVFGMVGHSAGGLAMMRARALHTLGAEKYAVIAAPFFPYVPLDTMRGHGAPEEALDHIKAILSDQFQLPWSALAQGEAYAPEERRPLLAVYDKGDPRVRHTDADALAEIWPGARLVKTEGYGHNRILRAEETLQSVREFIAA